MKHDVYKAYEPRHNDGTGQAKQHSEEQHSNGIAIQCMHQLVESFIGCMPSCYGLETPVGIVSIATGPSNGKVMPAEFFSENPGTPSLWPGCCGQEPIAPGEVEKVEEKEVATFAPELGTTTTSQVDCGVVLGRWRPRKMISSRASAKHKW